MEFCDPKGEFAMCVKVNGEKLQIHQIRHSANDPLGSRSEGWIVSEPESVSYYAFRERNFGLIYGSVL